MRVLITVLAFALLSLTTPGCGSGESGTEAANACSGVMCPPGTTHDQTASASSSCSGGGSVSVDLVDQSGSVTGQCFGSGECAIVCHPPNPCCGGEKWTTISYECATPCAGACDCTGRCDVIAGTECEVDCGDCTGTDLCSPDGYCEAGCGESETQCGANCCDVGETCHQNLCCDRVENCKGKQCGDDGCGGLCEAQDSIAGCAGDELCIAGTCSASGCEDIPSQCASEGGEEFINGCDEETLEWGKITDCSSESGTPYCDTVAGGPACVACSQDGHCGNPLNYACVDNACECTPACGDNECGDDGCGGSCGACEGATPNCLEKDGISGCYACVNDSDCGDDPFFWDCSAGVCSCTPDCKGETCGADGCGGWCGTCDGDGGCDAVGEKACSTGTGLEESLSCALIGTELQWQVDQSCSGESPVCLDGACVCTSNADCADPGEQCVGGACTYIAGCGNGAIDLGEFCPGPPIAIQSFTTPYDMEVADINQDGKVDIIVAHKGGPGSNGVTILFGDGTGGFGLAQDVNLMAGDVWEFELVSISDGTPDLLVRSVYLATEVYLDFYRGNGDGTFAWTTTLDAANHYAGFGIGPLNGDGKNDLVFQEFSPGTGAVDLSVAHGVAPPDSLSASEILYAAALPAPTQSLRDVEVVDMNGDGKGEVLMTTFGTTESDRVVIGSGYTSKPVGLSPKLTLTNYAVPTLSKSTADPDASNFLAFPFYGLDDIDSGDFDGNGKQDFVVSAGGGVAIWKASGTSFVPFFTHELEVASKSGDGDMGTSKVCVADMNGDSVSDLLVPVRTISASTSAGYGLVLLADPLANTMTAQTESLIDVGEDLRDIAAADLNGDNVVDIIVLDATGQVYVSLQSP